MKSVDGGAIAKRIRRVLGIVPCLLFTVSGLAQTKFDPTKAMAPAQLQRAMFSTGQTLPVPKMDPPSRGLRSHDRKVRSRQHAKPSSTEKRILESMSQFFRLSG